jgi:hypothetical protein
MPSRYYYTREKRRQRPAVPSPSRSRSSSIRCMVCSLVCPVGHRGKLPKDVPAHQVSMLVRIPAARVCCKLCRGRIAEWLRACRSDGGTPQGQSPPIVLPSLIPGAGNGLFTTRSYKPDELVSTFSGVLLREEELPPVAKREYVVRLNKSYYLNSRYLRSSAPGNAHWPKARYANGAATSADANCRIVVCQKRRVASLRAVRRLTGGEEITVNYGWQAATKRARNM